jgi:hypothetical protein
MKRPENLNEWYDLFVGINPILQGINSLGDCVDYETMSRYCHLKRKVVNWTKIPLASMMGIHSSHFLNIAVHANQLPSQPHVDSLSSHLGYDGINSVGPFEYVWICFLHLGIWIKVRRLDMMLLWGAALHHHMYWWKGEGHFVIVPFADRHLFPVFCVRRPKKTSFLPDSSETEKFHPTLFGSVLNVSAFTIVKSFCGCQFSW